MTTDDKKQLDELDAQRADVLAHRDRLQEELREVPAKLHLIDVRRKLVEEAAMPQATSGAKAGSAERRSLGMETQTKQNTEGGPAFAGPASGI